jgi:antibiotic biosynthesis monooxygenase (ABM) superfamily enzyme
MILRIWHGWTAPDRADAYEDLLRREVIPGIGTRRIPGFRGMRVLRRPDGEEVEFVTIMTFDTLDAVRAFAGEAWESAVVPARARALLTRFDAVSRHYEVRAEAGPDGS